MDNCTKAVRIVIGGQRWYYQSFYGDNRDLNVIRLYDASGEFVREFPNADDMTGWILEEVSRERCVSREKVQDIFMRRLEKLKGNMTDYEFAVYLGMTASTTYQYLTGRRFPSVLQLVQIADKCGVSLDWLVGRE